MIIISTFGATKGLVFLRDKCKSSLLDREEIVACQFLFHFISFKHRKCSIRAMFLMFFGG